MDTDINFLAYETVREVQPNRAIRKIMYNPVRSSSSRRRQKSILYNKSVDDALVLFGVWPAKTIYTYQSGPLTSCDRQIGDVVVQ